MEKTIETETISLHSTPPESEFFDYKKVKLHFHKYGEGKKTILAFHGYGQDYRSWERFGTVFGPNYTIIAIDLFFHGHSVWPHNDEPLTKEFWKEIIDSFLKQHGIERFSLAAFSMGGKTAFATLESFAERIDKVWLFAPDGIKLNIWYKLATYSAPLRKYFRHTIKEPGFFFNIATKLKKRGLLAKSLMKFVMEQMDTPQKRQKVYYSWMVYRPFKFNLNKISSLLNHNRIKLIIYIGRHDRVIALNNIYSFIQKVKKYELHVLDSGHNKLFEHIVHFHEGR